MSDRENNGAFNDILNKIHNNAKNEKITNNLFSVLGIETKELIHSRFIAFLLAPGGILHSGNGETSSLNIRHNFETKFLKIFLEQFYETKRLYKTLKEYKLNIEPKDLTKAQVFIEYEDTDVLEGRIDIFIKIGSYWIAIENKIYAGDQEKQLKRYHTYLKKKTKDEKFDLIYLTLDGHKPTDYSTDGLKKSKGYFTVGYKDFIIPWLDEIEKILKDEDPIKLFINQYKKVLDVLLGKHSLCEKILGDSKNVDYKKMDIFKHILVESDEDDKVKDYTKDLLFNYIYPKIINTTFETNYHTIDKEFREDCFFQENNTFIIYVTEDKKKEYDLYFEFTVDLKVIYYPIIIDCFGKKRYLWGENGKGWHDWKPKKNHMPWKTFEFEEFIKIFNRQSSEREQVITDIKEMRGFIKKTMDGKFSLPLRKK